MAFFRKKIIKWRWILIDIQFQGGSCSSTTLV